MLSCSQLLIANLSFGGQLVFSSEHSGHLFCVCLDDQMLPLHDFFGAVFSACSVQNKLKCKNNSVMDYLFMFDALILLESFAQISG